MTREELINTMRQYLNDTVKYYKTDFNYDIDRIHSGNVDGYYWIVRESGTHFTNNIDYVNAIVSTWSNLKIFRIRQYHTDTDRYYLIPVGSIETA